MSFRYRCPNARAANALPAPPGHRVKGSWVFSGRQGHFWSGSGAEGNLTIERFDFDGVIIHRIDTQGRTRGIVATYAGKVNGNRVQGNVSWTWPGHWGERSPSSVWFATITEPASYSVLNPNLLCNPVWFKGSAAEAGERAAQAIEARKSPAAVCWLRIGAERGDSADQGILAAIL